MLRTVRYSPGQSKCAACPSKAVVVIDCLCALTFAKAPHADAHGLSGGLGSAESLVEGRATQSDIASESSQSVPDIALQA